MKKDQLSLLSTRIDTQNIQLISPILPTNPEEVKNQVLAYFDNCVQNKKYYTFSGLAAHLGLTREELKTFCHENPTIFKYIQHAKQIIVDQVEQLIMAGTPPGGLTFWLKNNDNWIDKYEHEHRDKKISDILDEMEREGTLIKGEVVG